MDRPLTEELLLQRLAQGDERAFAHLYDQYQPKLYLFIFPLTAFSKQDTDEVIQDIFFKIWLRKETLTGVKSIQAYLFTMARNRLHDLRTLHVRQREMISTLENHQPLHHSEVQENAQFNEYTAIARQAINRLPAQKKKIFSLRNEKGLSLDEIAEELQITKFAVKKQLYDAIRFVKEYLKSNAGLDLPLVLLFFFYR
ncbi:RNA polymerase sigma factor [Chitinophaga vietnamensis]|uniref:RNA polymerase sigma factor n=1 Tax=Chitinophaga vietnamensis TaxID=2593957 RepID=UPI001178C3D9|nr:sigma-70 family RNA polymerase sigma factor [Chitinophaga vietnamensis]